MPVGGDHFTNDVAVALRTIAALRQIPPEAQPEAVWGTEVWRDLDWMNDGDKVLLDCTPHENLSASLMAIYDSQVCGGKRYDLATAGRRKAHATYWETHGTDVYAAINFAMDLTPLIANPRLEPMQLVEEYIDRFTEEVANRVGRLA